MTRANKFRIPEFPLHVLPLNRRQYWEVFTDYSTIKEGQFLALPQEIFTAFAAASRSELLISRRFATHGIRRSSVPEGKKRRKRLARLTTSVKVARRVSRSPRSKHRAKVKFAPPAATNPHTSAGSTSTHPHDSTVSQPRQTSAVPTTPGGTPIDAAAGAPEPGAGAGAGASPAGAGEGAELRSAAPLQAGNKSGAVPSFGSARSGAHGGSATHDERVAAHRAQRAAAQAEAEVEDARVVELAERPEHKQSGPCVNALEVLLILSLFCADPQLEQLQQCFNMFDLDGGGFISRVRLLSGQLQLCQHVYVCLQLETHSM